MSPEIIVGWIRQQTSWLYLQVYQNHLFFLDFWSIVHCWSGFVVFTLLLVLRYRQPWFWLFLYLFLYELVEISMVYWSLHVFRVETIKDQFTDIFVGLIGGYISYLFIYQRSRCDYRFFRILDFESLLVAMTLAFLWVGQASFFFPQPKNVNLFGLDLFFWRLLAVYLLVRIYASIKSQTDTTKPLLLFSGSCFSFYFLVEIAVSKEIYLVKDLNEIWQHLATRSHSLIYLAIFPFLAMLFHHMFTVILQKAAAELTHKVPRQAIRAERVIELRA